MKIDRAKLKKTSSEVPTDCKVLIEKLKSCLDDELLEELSKVKTWNCGKCELYHWIDVLDRFDQILEISCKKTKENQWCLPCDGPDWTTHKQLLLAVLQFTALLIEHSFSRNFYNSMEHLTTLLSSSDMNVVLAVLNLLHVFSKRSNFLTRLNEEKRQSLVLRLLYLAESWGGKENGFGLAECCQNLPITSYPSSASTLHFEYYAENVDKTHKKMSNTVIAIHIDEVDKITHKSPSKIMEEIVEKYAVPEDKQMQLFTHIRLAHSFSDYSKRILCVQARLQALSVLVYCNAVPDNVNSLLYNGFIEELVDVLELEDNSLIELKAAALRTLTSIIHLDKNPKLSTIIDTSGAASYHGFLPVLVRRCIQSLTDPESEPFPLPFATALFSFLYHLASYESGGDALVSCGMVEALLKVINWRSTETEHITFITRAVRVIDLITNFDMQAFHAHGGLASFIQRLEIEINVCRIEQPFEINPKVEPPASENQNTEPSTSLPTSAENQGSMEVDSLSPSIPSETVEDKTEPITADSSSKDTQEQISPQIESKKGLQCFPQRSALLKSMLNFLRKSIQDSVFADTIRHLIDGTLFQSLKHIISNAEYYGPSLFLLAIDIVTTYIYQEPTLLPSLQDSGLTDAVNHALLVKEVPATREVLSSLPNVFGALCLNTRGLQSFVACKPFEKLFRVLVSPEYLPAMRRRRSSDGIGDAASNLGNAVDELMRHQPSLRADATAAIIKLLEELCVMGRDPRYVCTSPTTAKSDTVVQPPVGRMAAPTNAAGSSSDDEDDEDEDAAGAPQGSLTKEADKGTSEESSGSSSKIPIPLVDYILNVMRFVDAILSNNSTDDHCQEFVRQKGLIPLISILGLPNLPIDFPVTPTCQSVSSVCKSILNLAHEPQVLKQGLLQLNEVLQSLEPLYKPVDPPNGSVLLEELINAPNINDATLSAHSTPLLHYMAAAHAYIIMFVHLCRTGQSDIRTISISHWASVLGTNVLTALSSLYTSLVWESTVLLALCSKDNGLPENCPFGRQQLEKLLHKDEKGDKEDGLQSTTPEFGSNGMTSAMEALSTDGSSAMDVDNPTPSTSEDTAGAADKSKAKSYHTQIKQLIKPLLSGASRLGRALAELFGLLVKLCVGSPMRQRRGQQIPPSLSVDTPAARAIGSAIYRLLTMGLSWEPPIACPVPKFRLTFNICFVEFTSRMLFDETKYPYHLMLQKFLKMDAFLDAFFNTFRWALTCGNTVKIEKGLENPQLPDGTGEFLAAWLVLLEKMVNPKNLVESSQTVLPKSDPSYDPSFDPVLYFIHIHKRAFESIMYLWNRKPVVVYGEKIAESMLTVICHLLKGETIIKEKLSKESAPGSSQAATASSSSTAARSQQLSEGEDVNQDHLTHLVEMGFSRSLVTEALLNTTSFDQAMDYLLSYPSSLGQGSSSGNAGGHGMDWELSEEDQMLRAIAMSLGDELVSQALGSSSAAENNETNKTDEQKEVVTEQQPEEPLSTQIIDEFISQVVGGCIHLADALPDTVYRCCDLLIQVAARNGEEWRNKHLIDFLLAELHSQMYYILERLKADELPEDNKWSFTIRKPWLNVESRFAVRLHLFALIFEEMKIPCAIRIEQSDLMPVFIKILDITALCMNSCPDEPPAKWLPFLVLLIDEYEKAAIASARKAPLLMAQKRQWKWFDERSGKWNNYSLSNNKLIDDAYKAGESTLHFTAIHRNYTVCLRTMVQINDETGNRRPIMFTIIDKEEKEKDASNKEKKSEEQLPSSEESTGKELPSPENEQSSENKEGDTQAVQMNIIKRLTPEQCEKLVRICVSLLKVPLEPDSLHAVMRLCLRLTRNYSNAILFANMDGPKILLSLTVPFTFTGYTSLTALLFRHILEDPGTLRNTMDKVIRSATAQGSASIRVPNEMNYVFRVLGPAACRDPELFTSVASSILRLASLPPSKSDANESLLVSYTIQMLKTLPAKSQTSETSSESEVANNLIYELLKALITKPVEVPEEATAAENTTDAPPTSDQQSPLRDVNNSELISAEEEDGLVIPLIVPNVDGFNDGTEASRTREANQLSKDSSKTNKPDSSTLKNIPIIQKSGICRLLAELVRSYSQCAKLITEYSFCAGDSELITEDCSALAFILDNLLPSIQTIGDRETPVLARVLLAAIASCNHSVEAQTSLVHEVRLALLRALSLPESNEKHTRIQALTGLISMMIDSCPPSHSSLRSGCTLRSQLSMNNVVKILLKKGIVVDLARVPHYLDLSSPHTAVTVNSALKPLETLSRIVNLPCGNITSNKAKSKSTPTRNREAASESMDEDASGAPCTSDMPFEVVDETQDIGLDTTIEIDQDPASFISTGNVDNTISDSAVDISEPDLTVSVEMEETPSSQTRGRRVRSFADSTNDDQQESTDSDSNSESEHSQSEDGVERDPRVEGTSADEDADVDEDADEDDDDDYDYDEDDDNLPFDMIDGYPEVDFFSVQDRDDNLFFQLEDIARSSRAVILGGSERIRTFQLPDIVDEATNSAENPAPTMPPAPRTVATTHPLLERHGEASTAAQSGVHRRQRGYRPNTGNHGWHVYTNSSNTSARRANRPVILQRLLGPSTAQDLLQLTSNSSSLPTSTALSRVVFENNDVRVTATLENLFDLPDRSSNLPSDNSTLASIPATLNRWAEESRVLDGDSVHDCVTGLKPAIIKCLEAYRDEELAERKEKEKKQQDKSGEKPGPKTPSNDLSQLVSMEVTEPCQHEFVESSDNNLPTISRPDESSETTTVPISSEETTPVVGTISTLTTVVTDLPDSPTRSDSTIASQGNSDLQLTSTVTPMDTTDAMDTTEDEERTRTSQLLSHEMLEESLCALSALSSMPVQRRDFELPPDLATRQPPRTEEEPAHLVEETANESENMSAHFTAQFETLSPEEVLQRSADQRQAELRTENVSASSDESQNSNASRQLLEVMQRRLDQRLAEISSENRTENMSASSDESQSSNTSTVITSYSRNLSEGPIILEGTVSDPEEFLTISSIQSVAPTVTVSLGSNSSEPPDMTVTLTEFVESSSGNDNDASSRTQSPSFSPNDTTPSERPTAPGTEASPAVPNVLDGVELPEGVDPSFLAALPDNIRQEVIAEQLRLQRLRQGTTNISSDNTNAGSSFTEVNPEFLAALPENIQEEVLAQQRAEQQRLAAQNSNPDIPLDPTSFIQTLPQGLRQQVLTDMDDSLLALLPPDVASEAHALRREVEARRRQIQERFFTSHGNSTLSRILRSASRVGGRYAIHTVPRGQAWADLDHIWGTLSGRGTSRTSGNAAGLSSEALSNSMRLRGRFLLDHEGLACLLVLLFVDDPQLNTVRLHRVLRNLCHHGPTRNWVIKSLLSILERTKDGSITSSPGRTSESANRSSQPSWLSISLDAALGCRTNVFQIRRIVTAHRRTSERHSLDVQNVLPNVPLVTIHPLASPVICRHVLDTLISLAKFFPVYFLPEVNKDKAVKDTSGKGGTSSLKPETPNSRMESDFWDVLVKLDSLSTTSRKGKAVLRNHRDSFGSASGSSDDESKPSEFETSPFAQLIGLLAHPVMKRSSVLTDRLLHLLAVISLALPDPKSNMKNKPSSDKQPEQDTESTCMSPFHKEVATTTGSGTADDPIVFISEEVDERRTVQHYLQLAVNVLTSKICSEEGLEDATALLLRISRGCKKTRQTVLSLLLRGARELGQDVCGNILRLLHELKYNLTKDKNSETDNKEPEYDGKFSTKGTIQDRFTNRAVVITAPIKIKGSSGRELHLASMQDLTSKASNQAFFLRILKVIIQLNELNQAPGKNKPTGGPRISLFRENEPNVPNEPRPTQNVGVGVSFDENMAASSVPAESTSTTEGPATSSEEAAAATDKAEEKQSPVQQEPEPFHLSRKLKLEKLWDALSDCLSELAETTDHHTVLVLQPAVEAFFLVHAPKKDKKKDTRNESRDNEMAHIQDIQPASPRSSSLNQPDHSSISDLPSTSSASSDTAKFLKFAETHRTVLNQILRQSTTPLADGPFSVLVDHTRVLDFDVKRRYFRQELEKMDEGSRREVVHDIAVHVRREHVFEDSYRELHRRPPEEWKNRFYIVFEGEEGQDAGGLLREWYAILSREIFNPMYALFTTSPGDRVTYMINSSSHCNSNHLSYFKFVGRVIAKAVYDNKLLESYFTRSFYKHILGKCVKYTDMESEDYSFYQGLVFLLEHDVKELGYELTFSVEVQEFGVTDVRDLKPNGRNLQVTEENKHEYVRLVCQEKMTGAIRQQLKAFLEGFYEIIPKRLISIFNEQELELLISGLPNIDIDDLKANTEYHKYQPNSLQIQWFWRALKSFEQADRANFLQFVTGTSKVPLQGFSALEGMNGAQKFQIHRDDRSTDRLPSAHTCFNQLDLPAYETYDKLRTMLLKAIHECSEGFGFA